jgi:ABC-type multidrug transport system fused ATPase/permease subunit
MYLVDNALLRRDVNALVLSAVLMFLATVVGAVLSYVSGYGYMRVSASMLLDMRLKVYAHLHALSPGFMLTPASVIWSRASTETSRKCSGSPVTSF